MSIDEQKYFVHPRAVVETGDIGEGSRIWGNAHVMKGVRIGKNCNIGEGCFIESGVVLGDNVIVKNNIAIWDGVTVEDDAFLGPNVVFTNDMMPRSGYPKELARTLVKKGASIGANATIIANITIGSYALIGAGAVVPRDVPAHRLVFGNPARIHGWACVCGRKLDASTATPVCECGLKYSIDGDSIKAIQ